MVAGQLTTVSTFTETFPGLVYVGVRSREGCFAHLGASVAFGQVHQGEDTPVDEEFLLQATNLHGQTRVNARPVKRVDASRTSFGKQNRLKESGA